MTKLDELNELKEKHDKSHQDFLEKVRELSRAQRYIRPPKHEWLVGDLCPVCGAKLERTFVMKDSTSNWQYRYYRCICGYEYGDIKHIDYVWGF